VASRIEPTHNETLVINRMMKHRYLWLTHHPVYGSPIIPVFHPPITPWISGTSWLHLHALKDRHYGNKKSRPSNLEEPTLLYPPH
jgi:hypothetical protein